MSEYTVVFCTGGVQLLELVHLSPRIAPRKELKPFLFARPTALTTLAIDRLPSFPVVLDKRNTGARVMGRSRIIA